MRERYEQEEKDTIFNTGSLSICREANLLSNPQPELDFHCESRILISNHNQSTILTPEKKTKASNTRTLCEYKHKKTLLLAQTRKPYFSML